MKYRKLRIAWSVFCGLACVLLILLWVRSYWWRDAISGNFTGRQKYLVASLKGRVHAMWDVYLQPPPPEKIYFGTIDYAWLKNSRLIEEMPSWRYGFRVQQHGGRLTSYHGVVPHWSLVTVSILLAAAPWVRWRRFSIRTLLIATTLIAAVLGLAVYAARN